MDSPRPPQLDVHSEAFLHSLMKRQLRLSVSCAAAFMLVLLALPLANYLFPELMARRFFGFTMAWFILGVLFFPLVWGISFLFIGRSNVLEAEQCAQAAPHRRPNAADDLVPLTEPRPDSAGPEFTKRNGKVVPGFLEPGCAKPLNGARRRDRA